MDCSPSSIYMGCQLLVVICKCVGWCTDLCLRNRHMECALSEFLWLIHMLIHTIDD